MVRGREILTLTVLRKRAGMTQETLALALARTSQPDVASWEAGNVKIPASKAEAILEILEIDLEIMARDLMRPWDEVLLDIHGIAV